MAISINWATRVISVPQNYLTNLGGGVYELDVDQFRLDLKELEDSEEGMMFPNTHSHNTTVTLSGVTYARTFEVINGYTVDFENGNYAVKCSGANHNISDVKVVDSVSLLIGNSSGLIQVTSGSGVTEQDKNDIVDRVWDEINSTHSISGSFGETIETLKILIEEIHKLKGLKSGTPLTVSPNQMTVDDIVIDISSSGNTTTATRQ